LPAVVSITIIPVNDAPIVFAGLDQLINLPANSVTLEGSVEDDGLPEGVSAAPLWTKVSGPGDVTFANPNDPSTTATFRLSGDYVLQLTADDSLAMSSDDVIVLFNAAPVVDAGPDQSIALTESATLNGVVADDAIPPGISVAISWSVISGPGTVTLPDPESAVTTARLSAVGTYVFRLTASDSLRTSSDEVTLTVVKPNEAPMVSAGKDQLVVWPSAANLGGLVNDDGLPAGAPLTFLWRQVSGPGTVTFANPFALSTSASFSQAGSYVLRLMANDSELNSFAGCAWPCAPRP
jgi:hypothetical protein